ncbi:MAG: hypothetical protein ACFB9M_20535 [Myxococcota bacterium]
MIAMILSGCLLAAGASSGSAEISVRAKIERIDDDFVLVERGLTPEQLRSFRNRQYPEVFRPELIRNGTIYQDRLYVLYRLSPDVAAQIVPDRWQGLNARLRLERNRHGHLVVTRLFRE